MELSVVLSLVMFAVFMALILTGYNVAFSFVATALAFSFIGDLTGTFNPNTLNVLPGRWQNALEDQTLLAVPLFVLMGAVLERSGLAERLLNAIGMLMGPLRGGVAAAVVIVGTMLAAATGVVAATVIVMGLLSLPAMVKLGYDNKLSTGVIVASGTLAQLLPPSLVLILLAQQLGVGILGLFAGALIPGLIMSGLYVAYALGISYLRPHLGPAMPKEQRTLPGKVGSLTAAKISLLMSLMLGLVLLIMSPRLAVIAVPVLFVVLLGFMMVGGMLTTELLVSIVPILALIVGVLFSIFQGIATPSESGAVGVLGALMLAVLNWYVDKLLARDGATHVSVEWRLTPKALKHAGTSTLSIVVLVMTLLFSSTFFSHMFFQLGGSDQTSEWLTAVGGGKYGFVAVAMVAVFLLGINLEFLE
ncbi:MAG TPA: C4-dicarboxylate ABC transporter, partial [Acidimicrobiaceae bacterium]|nr:C4-dicarboxylate ABC transporter [Acidimicrobiaceae bacterium]